MRNLMKRIVMVSIVLMLAITQSASVITTLKAQESEFAIQVEDNDIYSKKVSFSATNSEIKTLSLFLEEVQVATLADTSKLSFTIYRNGNYRIAGFGENGKLLQEEKFTVDSFTDFVVSANKDNKGVSIVSRNTASDYIQVDGASEAKLTGVVGAYGLKAEFYPERNGTYKFQAMDKNGKALSDVLEYKETSYLSVDKDNRIEIAIESDLLKVKNNPQSDFILVNDIEVKMDILKDITFQGTLYGNGYVISGIKDVLFNKLENAKIDGLTLKGGALANSSTNTTILNSGFYVELNNEEKDAALLLKSENTSIENSYVLANMEGKNVAGFVLEGNATIKNSYVSGYLEGESIFGFGKQAKLDNCYVSASLNANKVNAFSEEKENTECFYDAQVNAMSFDNATAYTQAQLTSKDFDNDQFLLEEGLYPQIKNESLKEEAKKVSVLSAQVVSTSENLSTLSTSVTFDKEEGMEWKASNATIVNEQARLSSTSGEIQAQQDGVTNRFLLKEVKTVNVITPGKSTALELTQVTYPVTYGKYYKVDSSKTAPATPKTHKEAITQGWKIAYWTGVDRIGDLTWDTEYNLYTCDLNTVTSESFKTNKGLLTGSITLSGNYDSETTTNMVASFNKISASVSGTLYWEYAPTLDSKTWTELKKVENVDITQTYEYEIEVDELYYNYLRARFVVANEETYAGVFTDATSDVLKHGIDEVSINNNHPKTAGSYSVGDGLSATIKPEEKANDVIFKWYHEGVGEPIYEGKNYRLIGNDIGKKIYVVAVAKEKTQLKGELKSNATSEVIAVKRETPNIKPKLVAVDDKTVTIKMEDDTNNDLYTFKVEGESVPDITIESSVRGSSDYIILGLNANSTYKIRAKIIGENGYLDSDFADDSYVLTITTTKQRVQGSIEITGKPIYGETLTQSLISSNTTQKGDTTWYRIDDDNNRIATLTTEPSGEYKIKNADIGYRIEVSYTGNGEYGGEISNTTDVIMKAESNKPTVNVERTSTDTTFDSVEVYATEDVSNPNRKYILGYSTTATGVPIEYIEDEKPLEMTQGNKYTIRNLKRDTKYYFFIRLAANETNQKSDWISSDKALEATTTKKVLEATIGFEYERNSGEPMQGDVITSNLLTLDTQFDYKGTWSWTRIKPGGLEEKIYDFEVSRDRKSSFYKTPSDEEIGTKYRVDFVPSDGFITKDININKISGTSLTLAKKAKQKYVTPNTNDINVIVENDSTVLLSMKQGAGLYKFRYKTESGAYVEVDQNAYSGVEIKVDGLNRNTNYIFSARRIEDTNGYASDWSNDSASYKTDKTEIAGFITLTGEGRNKETLTAKYESATYSPTGDDTGGTWKWYRNGTEIVEAMGLPTYKLKDIDVNKIISVRYTAKESSNFVGSVDAQTAPILKAYSDVPSASSISSAYDKTNNIMKLTLNMSASDTSQKVYYVLQKSAAASPNYPTTDVDWAFWKEVKSSNLIITQDSNSQLLEAMEQYTLYMLRTGNDYTLSSGIVSQVFTMGTKVQTGNIVMSGNFVVDKTVTATLSDSNNKKGYWRWYRSTTTKTSSSTTMPSVSNSANWVEITSGFNGYLDVDTSSLRLTSDMWGYFIRADFVASDDSTFSGSLTSVSNSSQQKHVRRILEETVKIESDKKDGFGTPRAYSQATITATMENSYEQGGIGNNHSTSYLRFKIGGFEVVPSRYYGNTFSYRFDSTERIYDNLEVTAQIPVPNRYWMYCSSGLSEYSSMTSALINSKSSTNTSFKYIYGIAINSGQEFNNFVSGAIGYTQRNVKYILTENINISSLPAVSPTSAIFSGIFDGDSHTIVGMKNTMFTEVIGSSSSNRASVRNCIIYNSNIQAGVLGDQYLNSGAVITRTGTNFDLDNLFLIDSTLTSEWDTGYFIGKTRGGAGNIVNVRNCGSAGGWVKTTKSDTSLGGLAGSVDGDINIEQFFSIGTQFSTGKVGVAGVIGFISGGFVNIYRSYIASKIPTKPEVYYGGGIIARIISSSNSKVESVYNDTKINPTGQDGLNTYCTNVETSTLMGSGKAAQLGSNWTFKDGFYPQLKWLNDHPILNLYTATRASFTSADNYTTVSERLSGLMFGTLVIPERFQDGNYEITSSDPAGIRVVGNTLVPVSRGKDVTITVTYKEPNATIGGSVKNTFNFRTQLAIPIVNVSIKGDAIFGSKLEANATGGDTTPTYQWYRRASGSSTIEKISGATNQSYSIKASDIGYQLMVEVDASEHGDMRSAFTSVVSSTMPTSDCIVRTPSDNSITFYQTGMVGAVFEYAYQASNATTKTILDGTYANNIPVTISSLQRNKSYTLSSRIAGGSGYPAGPWRDQTVTTAKTAVKGAITFGNNINNGTQLSISADKTNGQTGTWKLERIKSDGTTEAIPFSASSYTINYSLTNNDVGCKIKATFTGTGDFNGNVTATSKEIQRAIFAKPTKPTLVTATNSSLTLNVGTAGNVYDIAIASNSSDVPIVVKTKVNGATDVVLDGLNHNTTYYVYVRGSETDAWIQGPYSDAQACNTSTTVISGNIVVEGNLKTAQEIKFKANVDGSVTGRWTLGKVENGTQYTTISSKLYTVSPNTQEITYTVRASDASEESKESKYVATFVGTGDYQGNISYTSNKIEKAQLTIDDMPKDKVVASDIRDHSFTLKTTEGNESYQFGIAEKETTSVKEILGKVEVNKELVINDLDRNKEYDVYIRKAAKVGYTASEFVKTTTTVKTSKTALNGYVTFTVKDDNGQPVSENKVGSALIGYTYTAMYHKGSYSPDIDDSNVGQWAWYADGELITDSVGNDSFTVPAMIGTPDISVRFTALASSDFLGSRDVSVGILDKSAFGEPNAPEVEVLEEDKQYRSKIKLTSTEDLKDVYWYVQKTSFGKVPETVGVDEASSEVKENVWFKANDNTVITLDAYTEYIVYAARLETTQFVSSAVISTRAFVTKKDDLKEIGAEILSDNVWKVAQEKQLIVDCGGLTTTGTWQFYVRDDTADESKEDWQNINLDVKNSIVEGVNDQNQSYINFEIPLKYIGKYVIVEYSGRSAYSNEIYYRAQDPLEGTLLKGYAKMDATEATVNETVNVSYTLGENVAIDDSNGYWRWYRETGVGTNKFELIIDDLTNKPYGIEGEITDSYELSAEDVNRQIYAEYAANKANTFTGTVATSRLNSVRKAEQNKPNKVELKQVNGTDIQVKFPNNYSVSGTTLPDVVLGYRLANTNDTITWQNKNIGDSWIRNLDAKKEYEVFVKFVETSEFKESVASDSILVTTGFKLFDDNSLILKDESILESGSVIEATYTGLGVVDGEFEVRRSDGQAVSGVLEQSTIGQVASMKYTCSSEDIGANIIIVFKEKSDAKHYGGEIQKASRMVEKPENPASPTAPMLQMVTYEETALSATVSKDYEYVLSKSADAITDESDWQKLTTVDSETHKFTELTNGIKYYLHARIAETKDYRSGNEIVSSPTKPWEKTLYAIYYYGMENAYYESTQNPTQYSEIDNVKLIEPIKKGYEFTGWTFGSETNPNKNVEIPTYSNGDKEFTANWKINSYDVKFVANDGSGDKLIKLEYDSLVSEPESLTKKGHTFIGWYSDAQYGKAWNFVTDRVSDSDLTLYAKWQVNKYKITFNGNGGNTVVKTIDYGDELGVLPVSQRDGYHLKGWYTKAVDGESISENTKVDDSDAEYFAQWNVIDYQIQYDLKDGINTGNPDTYNYESGEITLNEPTKKGSTFMGWTFEGQEEPIKEVTIPSGSFGDKKFTANWKVIEFSIKYELEGGTNNSNNPTTYTADDKITLLAPRKEKHMFTGWTYKGMSTPQKDVVIDQGSEGDKIFTAHWKQAEWQVTFDAQGGTNINAIWIATGELVNAIEAPMRVGYTFDGWYKDAATTIPWDFDQDKVNSNLKLYAKWKVQDMTITFDSQGGSNVSQIITPFGKVIGTLSSPTKEGYQFLGWYSDMVGGTKLYETTLIQQDATYYAQWECIPYKIEYILGMEGKNDERNPLSYTVEDETITLRSPSKPQKIFKGWTYDGQNTPILDVSIQKGSIGDKKFTAVWEDASIKVSFNSQGGNEVSDVWLKTNTVIEKPSDPIRVGYDFTGWYSDAQTTQKWNFATPINEDKTLYAGWSIQRFDVIFDGQNGEIATSVMRSYQSSVGKLPTVTKTGYVFKGWFTHQTGGVQINEQESVTCTVSYFAQWEKEVYAIDYVLNGGINAVSNPKTYTIEDDFTLHMPTKKNYAFTGWTYEGQDTPTFDVSVTSPSTGNKSYVANWQACDYVVKLNTNGGTIMNDVYVKAGDTLATLAEPKKEGYTFEGWYSDAGFSKPWNITSSQVNQDITLYAKWSTQQFDINFDANGGSRVATMSKAYGSKLNTLPTTTKEGYDFLGWFTKKEGGTKISSETLVNGQVTYFAHWKAKQYNIIYKLDGGMNNVANPMSYTIEDETFTLEIPSKENYMFVGWTFEGQDSPTMVVSLNKGSVGNKTFIANWDDADAKITFDSAGGSAIAPIWVKTNSLVPSIEAPVKEGYRFLGWKATSKPNEMWDFTSDCISQKETTFTAQWEKEKYQVSFDAQNNETFASSFVSYNDAVGILPAPQRKGYHFAGWFDEEGRQVQSTTLVKTNLKLQAKWVAITYSIAYVMEEGINPATNPTSYTIEDNIVLREPTRKEYVFTGWTYNTSMEPIKQMEIAKGSIGNKTFTAKWKTSDYTVQFDSNGGSIVDDMYALNDTTIAMPTAPTKNGHTFIGWYEDTQLQHAWDFDKSNVVKNMTLYAKWEVNSYNVCFDGNGGDDAARRNVKFDDEIGTLPSSSRTGYLFDGWYTQAIGGFKVSATTKLGNQDMTYYAHWKVINYQLRYDLAGGSVNNPTSYTVEDEVTLNQPTRKGYTFTGWTSNDITTPQLSVVIEIGSVGEQKFVANWQANTYKVTYDLAGGSAQNISFYTIEDAFSLNAPKREGYEFAGWTYTGQTTPIKTVEVKAGNIGDRHYVAHWVRIIPPLPPLPPIPTPTPKPTPNPIPNPIPNNKTTDSDYTLPVIKQETPIIPVEGTLSEGKLTLPSTINPPVDGKSEIKIGKGSLKVDVDTKVNVKDLERFVNAVLSPKQLQKVAEGNRIEIRLSMNEKTQKEVNDYGLIDAKAKEKELEIVKMFDVNIEVKENDKWSVVEKLHDTIEIIFQIPKDLQSLDAQFFMLHLHDSKVDVLSDKDEENDTVTVETQSFSVYTMSYSENTSNNTFPWLMIVGLVLVGGVFVVVYKRKKQDD